MNHIKPIGMRVLVEVVPEEQGCIITTEKETPKEGVVVAVGDEVTLVEIGNSVGWGGGFTGQPIQSDGKNYIQIEEDSLEYVR